MRQVNPIINAIASERFDKAVIDAKEADELCQRMTAVELENQFPLMGVPFTVKECIGVKGKDTLRVC